MSRRLFSPKITESDAFLSLPLSAQALYFHLCMNADDEGFVNSPRRVAKVIGAKPQDLAKLLAARFILGFDSGVIVIKHWLINNSIRADRKRATDYQEELDQLEVKPNGAYTEKAKFQRSADDDNQMTTKCQPNDRLSKVKLRQVNINNNIHGRLETTASESAASDYDPTFEATWRLTPKHDGRLEGKKPAYAAYKRSLKAGHTPEEIRAGIEALAKRYEEDQTPPRFIPKGSTIYSQERWADALADAGKSEIDREVDEMERIIEEGLADL